MYRKANSIAKILGLKPDNSDEVITAASIKLAPFGVPADHFLEASYLRVGFLPKLLAKHLKFLNTLDGDEHLEKVLQLGVSNRYFSTVKNCPAQGFYDFLIFLKSPAGQIELSHVAFERNLMKRAPPGYSIVDVAYGELLKEQGIDAKNAMAAITAKYKAMIEELKAQIRMMEAAHKRELKAAEENESFNRQSEYGKVRIGDFEDSHEQKKSRKK